MPALSGVHLSKEIEWMREGKVSVASVKEDHKMTVSVKDALGQREQKVLQGFCRI